MLYPVTLGNVAANISSPAGDHLNHAFRRKRFYEEDLLLAVTKYLSPGDLAIDCGGHVGNHSAYFSHFCDVLAFEPNPASAAHWRKTMVGRNGTLIEAPVGAVSNVPYGLVLAPSSNTGMTRSEPDAEGTLRSTTIDSYTASRHVGLIKIDVEGQEVPVLRGATKTISRCLPVILAEAHTEDAAAQIDEELAKYGYIRGKRYCSTPTYIWRVL